MQMSRSRLHVQLFFLSIFVGTAVSNTFECESAKSVSDDSTRGTIYVPQIFYGECSWIVGGPGRTTTLSSSSIVNRAPAYSTVAIYGASLLILWLGAETLLKLQVEAPYSTRMASRLPQLIAYDDSSNEAHRYLVCCVPE